MHNQLELESMMQIYKLDGNNIDIVSCPPQDVRKGDYLMIEDSNADRGLIVQVINISYANVPGILEDILRGTSTEEIRGNDLDILRLKPFIDMIKDAKILNCKIRRALVGGKLNYDLSWTPSRSASRIIKLPDKELLKIANIYKNPSITLGTSKGGATVSAGITSIDGTLNIVTGKKGSGKSHLSKLLVLNLISHGGICVIFDINGEYTNLGYTENGNESDFHEKILVLCPGNNFKVTLNYAGLGVLLDIVSTVLDLPTTSTWEIRRIWRTLDKNGYISFKKLGEAIYSIPNNYVRDAILRRYESLRFMLSKLCRLLEKRILNAVFLIAEEAHLYLRETYWEDIVTRMRHLGIFATFITNQPDSIDESVYRQADNIFLFNFTNENDLNTVSKATMTDVETINTIAKELPPHHCLILGKVVNDFPIISKINRLRVKTMGHTRFFFTELHKS
jgi:DNA helicase HerA-like ATPase